VSYPGITATKFGRYAVAEPLRLDRLHLWRGETLREVDHEPPLPVLDQEDLFAQQIDVSALVPGAQRVDALGSCTCQAGTVSLAERWHAQRGHLPKLLGRQLGADTRLDECAAILLYHAVTAQTGDPATEWPPTDCGSTGLYVCAELERLGLTKGYRSAHDVTSLVSLLQSGTVIQGTPWFRAWMEPDSMGFVDGEGTVSDLQDAIGSGVVGFVDGEGTVADFQAAIASGVVGGHETCISAVERLTFDALGRIVPEQSHVRVRNSWSASWGDHGSFRLHLSTLALLGSHADYKQFVV
jgi:hypothetical protein